MGKIKVLVAGLPGKMATLVAETISSQDDMELLDYGLSEQKSVVHITPTQSVHTSRLADHKGLLLDFRKHIDLIVDFTQPASVNSNAEMYCELGIPFVIGTTGGDRQKLRETIEKSGISAVVATNMGIPIVVFQAMIHFAAANFPNALEGFKLSIRESHQAQKPDPSGTAVSLLESFNNLGIPIEKEQINMVRNSTVQEVEMDIPKQHLAGHGYHTYTLLSPDGSVKLQFTHNVLGRNVYAVGALRAIRFLAVRKETKGKVFSMIDVLQ